MEPVFRLLVNVESTTNLYSPSVAQSHLAIMELRVLGNDQFNVEQLEAVGDRPEFSHRLIFLSLAVELGEECDLFGRTKPDGGFAESKEIYNLVVLPNVSVLHFNFVGTGEIITENRVIRVAGCSIVDSVVSFFRREICCCDIWRLGFIFG